MNIKHTLLIGMAMSFSACTQNVNNSDIIPGTADVASLAGVKTIKIENFENEMYCKYSDLYSDVRYVPLEYTQNSMVGNVHEMLITKNNDIVILDYYAKAIFLFDSEGKYKNRIGDAGHAENEYIEPLNMVYDEYRDNVIVYDNAKKVLAYYDMDGTYLHKIQLKDYIGSFEVLDKDHLVLFYNYKGEFLKEDDINYNYKIIDNEGKVVKEFAPYDKITGELNMYSDVFYKNKGELYCHIQNTPIVNKITLDSMTPVYNIDFGDYQMPNEWYMQGESVFLEKVESLSPNRVVTEEIYQTDSTTFISFSYRPDEDGSCWKYMATIQGNKTDKFRCFINMFNDMYGKQDAGDVKHVENGMVYYVLDPTFLKTLSKWPTNVNISKMMAEESKKALMNAHLGSHDEKIINNTIKIKESKTTSIVITEEEKEFVEKLSKTSNPIIQICKIK
ncbi:MAG: 6-bladed beta-propeller [Bacteroidaceae bacterium]|nr:6-bladed beta-propeller [Bacteroidaceae bacterium]